MTRLAILADIHGNLPALEAVLEDFARFTPIDQVIVAGDVINWGPFSAEVTEIVAREGWAVIRGNNEFYLLDYGTPRAPASWQGYTLIPWLRRQLQGRWHGVIAAWPDTLCLRYPDAPPLRVFHGTPRDAWEPIFEDTPHGGLNTMLDGVEETVLVAAHTHLPMDRRDGGRRLFNPGSVGIPLDGVFEASYLLLEARDGEWHPTFRGVPFDNAAVFREFERQNFVEECGPTGHLVQEEFRTARLQLDPFLRWRRRHYPDAPITWDLVRRFSEVDIREYTPAIYNRAWRGGAQDA